MDSSIHATTLARVANRVRKHAGCGWAVNSSIVWRDRTVSTHRQAGVLNVVGGGNGIEVKPTAGAHPACLRTRFAN